MRRLIRKLPWYLFLLLLVSCNVRSGNTGRDIVTVSIPPFGFFVEEIGGGDFEINVMVPSGSDPHIYEPVPEQITALRRSAAYISNGYLGFEMTWLDRFYEANPEMIKLSLAEKINLVKASEHSDDGHLEGADPHYWVSPKSALVIAGSVKELLSRLKPDSSGKYQANYQRLCDTISDIDRRAEYLFSSFGGRSFMIFHPALGYIARDYNLNQIAVEHEGKEPDPSSMRKLIDIAARERIKVILIQKGFDTKNAGAIALETGAVLSEIDPLSENWTGSVNGIIDAIYKNLAESNK